MRKYKKPNRVRRGKNHPNWKGGRYEVSNGYAYIKIENHPFKNGDGYVPEHRYVMEKHIGRYLKPEEIVHHINKIKNDNSIKNLILCANEREHRKYHS